MQERENRFNKKQEDDRNLFADESDIFGEEQKKSGAGFGTELPHDDQEEHSFSDDEADLSYEEEKPANSVRRILLIAASVVAGIGLGVGGYLFFTAGNKIAPAGKQVVKVLPGPAAVPMPPALPSDKPNVIPEIPVKTEPQHPEKAQEKEVKSQESLPKSEARNEPLQKPAAEKPKQETAPAAAVKSEEKKPLPKQAAKEAAPAAKGKGAYYVQAGLFENEKNANAVALTIRQKGFKSTISKVTDAQKRTLYRVTVGQHSNYKKALKVSEALGQQGVKAIVKQ